jgi:hypothetical protein
MTLFMANKDMQDTVSCPNALTPTPHKPVFALSMQFFALQMSLHCK